MATKSKKKVTVKRKISSRKIQKGTVGNFFVFGVLALLMVLGITAVGGLPSQMAPSSGQVVRVVTPTPGQNYNNLQLKWFGYVTIAPTPTPAKASLCTNKSVNTEPEILEAYYPGPGQTTGSTGQVKVWVNDEGPPIVAPGEQINTTTGAITKAGDRTAKAPDGYLWEPSLYIAPSFAESGGTPHFPDAIKGVFNNTGTNGFRQSGVGTNGPTPDTIPAGSTVPTPADGGGGWFGGSGSSFNKYTAEYIWNVSGLGLSAGTYQAEFVIHDGDIDRGVGCVTITIQ
jgi:hypothetical protein